MRDYLAIAKKYSRDVLSGRISACKYVHAACQRQVDDLKTWPGKRHKFIFDSDRASDICFFVEHLPHIKGPKAGQLIILEPWQVFILTTVCGWIKQDKSRRYRRVYVEVPRGNGKSALSSAVALYMLCADNESGAEVYSFATTRDQARIVFGDAQNMVRRTAALRSEFGVDVNAHNINVVRTASKFEALSAEGSTLDGLNTHFACIDELHAHKTRAVYDVVETSIGKRAQSMLWVITTAGSNRAGICYEVRKFATQILDGVAKDDSQFAIIYGLDSGDDWTTEDALRKANPNWEVSVMPDVILPLQAKAMHLPSAAANFKTKHLCEWVNADSAWMDMRAWDACADLDMRREDFVSDPCWIGLDLASKVDLAAKVSVHRRKIDGVFHYYVFGRYYLPEETAMAGENSQYMGWVDEGHIKTTPGAVLEFEEIETDLLAECATYSVEEVPYDPFQATQLSTRMVGQGLPMVEMRATVLNFSEPMKQLAALVLQRRLHHSGDPVLAWMVSNVVAHFDAKDNIYPRKERPENKIDGVVALIMAIGRAMHDSIKPSLDDFLNSPVIG